MSWHFSRALAEEFSAAECSAGELSARSNSTTTLDEFSWHGRATEASSRSLSGTTCAPSTGDRGLDLWMSYLAGSRARTSASLAMAPASTASGPVSGASSLESFARFDRDSCSWRTLQPSLLGDSDEFSGTWPRSGTMRNGVCWERATLAPITGATGFGLLPTPTATQYGTNRGGANPDGPERASLDTMARRGDLLPTPTVDGNYNRKGASAKSGDGLHTAVMKLATPTSRDWHSGKASPATMERNARPLSEQIGGLLNPEFVERMMGWPKSWSDATVRTEVQNECSSRQEGSAAVRAVRCGFRPDAPPQERKPMRQLRAERGNRVSELPREAPCGGSADCSVCVHNLRCGVSTIEVVQGEVVRQPGVPQEIRGGVCGYAVGEAHHGFGVPQLRCHVHQNEVSVCPENVLEVVRQQDSLAESLRAHQWGDWREWDEPAIVGKLPDRANRIKRLGNGQVPQCAAEAWRQLVRRIEP